MPRFRPARSFLAFAASFLLAALALNTPRAAHAQAVLPTGFSDELITGGLTHAPSMVFLPDYRLLVVEKYESRIRLVVNGMLLATPVAVIDSLRQTSESGLLGIAVDPAWPVKPYVYVHYNYLGSRSIRVARYTAVGDVAGAGSGGFTLDLASRHLVLADLPDQTENHNGGGVRFGADGMLYVSLGDDLNQCYAVLKDRLQGKIVRLDVSGLPPGPGGPPTYAAITPVDNPFVTDPSPAARLVWTYGLRNPYSFHIDAPTGDLVIADVGGAYWEELDFQDHAGANFGWPTYEGPINEGATCAVQDSLTARWPIYFYDRTAFTQGAAIITSPRYRRPAAGAYRFPVEYEGDVFVSDVGEGIFRRVKQTGSSWGLAPPVAGQPSPTDFGTGMIGVTDYLLHPDGSLWYLKYAHYFMGGTGQVRRIVYHNTVDVPPPSPDASGISLGAPYPSPASASATFRFGTTRRGPARLAIFDLTGREVRRLLDEAALEPARHTREWDLRDDAGDRVAPGLYFARFESDGMRTSRRLSVLR